MESILTSIKKLLGITKDYTHFDADIVMHINSVFMTLTQLGVGPSDGFFITDETTTWDEFIKDPKTCQAAKSYIFLKVKLLFDSQTMPSAVITSYNEMIREFEWRLCLAAESCNFTDSSPDDTSTTIATLGYAIIGQLQLGYAGG